MIKKNNFRALIVLALALSTFSTFNTKLHAKYETKFKNHEKIQDVLIIFSSIASLLGLCFGGVTLFNSSKINKHGKALEAVKNDMAKAVVEQA